MQNRDDYLQAIGIQQWQRRQSAEQAVQTWHYQGPKDARFAFVWQQQNRLALDWSQPELQLLEKIMQAVNVTPEKALLLWPLQDELDLAPPLPQSCCCVIFGEALAHYVKHTKKIKTLSLTELGNDVAAKKALWQALKKANHE
jgi:DNA polymerase III psi subunit